MDYDVIVVGVGGMGSAAAWQLARRGQRVLGLERYDIPHAKGPRTASAAIIRLAYYEDPAYVPLLRRAYELWREAEAARRGLLVITGSIDASPEDDLCSRARWHRRGLHDLPHEMLTGARGQRAIPRLPAAGERCARCSSRRRPGARASGRSSRMCALAQAHGAEIRARERVLGWEPTRGEGVRCVTDKGRYEAARLVLTAGAWVGELAPPLAASRCRSGRCWPGCSRSGREMVRPRPVSGVQPDGRRRAATTACPVYEVPGFKFGRYHHQGETGAPDTLRARADAADEALLRLCRALLPRGGGPTMALRACMFTNTPDEHFILDQHPRAHAGHGGLAVFRSRLQVLQRDRRDPGRPGDRRRHTRARHRLPAAGAATRWRRGQ